MNTDKVMYTFVRCSFTLSVVQRAIHKKKKLQKNVHKVIKSNDQSITEPVPTVNHCIIFKQIIIRQLFIVGLNRRNL